MDEPAVRILAWLAAVGALVEFVLVDELRGRNARIAAGAGMLLIGVGLAVTALEPEMGVDPVWAATPPLSFFLLASLLNGLFRWLKGSEPHVVFTPQDRRRARLTTAARPAESRHEEAWDTTYTLMVGIAWLLTLMPAVTRLG